MRLHTIWIKAGEEFELGVKGDYVRIRKSAVDLTIIHPQKDEKIEVSQGDDFEFSEFDSLRISHASDVDQQVKIITSRGKRAGSAQVGGSVTVEGGITILGGEALQGRESVTNENVELLPENQNRRFLMIQNNDLSGVLRVTLDGSPATAAAGFRLEAGDSMDFTGYNPRGAVNVIMETPSAAADNVEFMEG